MAEQEMEKNEQITDGNLPLKTIDVTLKILAKDVPDVFDAVTPVYIYDPQIEDGQWVSSRDELYNQWMLTKGQLVLKLFEVGSLPACGLRVVAEQGIAMPYWRQSLRELQGWIICQAQIVQVGSETWCVKQKNVFYMLGNGPITGQM